MTKPFDYGSISDNERETVQQLTSEIYSREAGKKHSDLLHALEVGAILCQVKEALSHGKWGPWLKVKCPIITSRTATNYMNATAAFAGKSEIVSDLKLTTVYALARPDAADIRDELLEGGNPLVQATVEDALKKFKSATLEAMVSLSKKKRRDPKAVKKATDNVLHQREEWTQERDQQQAQADQIAARVLEQLPPDTVAALAGLRDWRSFADALKQRLPSNMAETAVAEANPAIDVTEQGSPPAPMAEAA